MNSRAQVDIATENIRTVEVPGIGSVYLSPVAAERCLAMTSLVYLHNAPEVQSIGYWAGEKVIATDFISEGIYVSLTSFVGGENSFGELLSVVPQRPIADESYEFEAQDEFAAMLFAAVICRNVGARFRSTLDVKVDAHAYERSNSVNARHVVDVENREGFLGGAIADCFGSMAWTHEIVAFAQSIRELIGDGGTLKCGALEGKRRDEVWCQISGSAGLVMLRVDADGTVQFPNFDGVATVASGEDAIYLSAMIDHIGDAMFLILALCRCASLEFLGYSPFTSPVRSAR